MENRKKPLESGNPAPEHTTMYNRMFDYSSRFEETCETQNFKDCLNYVILLGVFD